MIKRVLILLVFLVVLMSCSQSIQKADVQKLNGYWEIEKVVFDGGEDKEYTINETFDYFRIDTAGVGIRKKVMPQLDGTFLTNDTFENVKVRFKDGKVYLDYSTFYAKWSEELVQVNDTKLVLKNKEDKEYHYKKTDKIDLVHDGKKNK